MNRNIAVLSDLNLYGKSLINTSIPIISMFGDKASFNYDYIYSNDKKYEYCREFSSSENFKDVLNIWNSNKLVFDAILLGKINNYENINIVREYIADMKLENQKTLLIVDPSLSKDGKKYEYVTDNHINNYKKLMEIADIIIPNLSDACLLVNESYDDYMAKYCTITYDNSDKEKTSSLSKKIITTMLPILDKLRIKKNQISIVTGIELYNSIVTILDIYDGDNQKRQTTCNFAEKIEKRTGCGNLFDIMYLEACLNGFNMVDALSLSTSFVNNSLRFTRDKKYDDKEGVVFEPILYDNMIAIRNKQIENRNKLNGNKEK